MRSQSLYVPSHGDLPEHPKLRRLMKALGLRRVEALGHLHLLWAFTLRYASDGDLSEYSDEELAEAADWTRPASELVTALVSCGWLEEGVDERGETLRAHDWMLYAGAAIRARSSTRERVRRHRERKREQDDAGVTVTAPKKALEENAGVTVTAPKKAQGAAAKIGAKSELPPLQSSAERDVTVTETLRNSTVENRGEKNRGEKRRGETRVDTRSPSHADAETLARELMDGLMALKPDIKPPSLARWTSDADKLLRLDNVSHTRASAVIAYVTGQTRVRDQWWVGKVLSMEKLRKEFDRIEMAYRLASRGGEQHGRPTELRARAAGEYQFAVVQTEPPDEEYWQSVGGHGDE